MFKKQFEQREQCKREIDTNDMKQLFVIGNGFDIHHKIPSSYKMYRDWLEEHDSELLESLRCYYDVDDGEWWSQFEIKLGHPDMVDYIDKTSFENEPDYGSDDFRDRDYYAGQFAAEAEIGTLVADIKETFTDWVGSLPAPNSDKKIKLDKDDAFFINFNYTDTLQTLYNVKATDILFIHGNVGNGTELILGHNRPYDEIDSEFAPEIPVPPDGLSDEELAEWCDVMADSGENYIHLSVREEVVSQIHRLRKDTEGIIKVNKKSFESLKDVKIIHVYGLSFSPVDVPYLDKIVSEVNAATTKWIVSWYEDEDKMKAKRFFQQKGINAELVSYIKLNDILLIKQSELKFEE